MNFKTINILPINMNYFTGNLKEIKFRAVSREMAFIVVHKRLAASRKRKDFASLRLYFFQNRVKIINENKNYKRRKIFYIYEKNSH